MAPKKDGYLTDNNGDVHDGKPGKLDGESVASPYADMPLEI